MKSGRLIKYSAILPRKQHGVVLLIALIVLVAMTMAGIGMMRSVDTGSLIAGNMAFRQAAANANDAGISAGFNALVAVANTGNSADIALLAYNNGQSCANAPLATAAKCNLGGNIIFPGYYSTPRGFVTNQGLTIESACQVVGGCIAKNNLYWTHDEYWSQFSAPPVQVPDINGSTIDVYYVIERMCTPVNGVDVCQTIPWQGSGSTKSTLQSGGAAPNINVSVYRITTRAVGARSSVTYSQALVTINYAS
jgi:Tfp pilus assembly protein PilX